MKNILFIAPYRQLDGWGLAAKDYARALETTGYNIAIRPVYMGSSVDPQPDDQLLEMERRRFDHYDVIIQKVLPHLYVRRSIPTIALFTLEVGNVRRTPWYPPITIMDGIMVPSKCEKDMIDSVVGDGVRKTPPCWAISEPVNVDAFNKEYKKLEGIPQNTFNFYFIGDIITRKNLDALIIAFHREFTRNEPVSLIIKASKHGMNPKQLADYLQQYINNLKLQMRIYDKPTMYKSELLITHRLTDEEVYELHAACHCFVMPSHGEAFCRPVVDALGFGNCPIVTANTGMDYVRQAGWLVPSTTSPVLTGEPPLANMYTSRETWQDIDILHLQEAMRCTYQSHGTTVEKMFIEERKQLAQKFSYTHIGYNMKEALEDYDTHH